MTGSISKMCHWYFCIHMLGSKANWNTVVIIGGKMMHHDFLRPYCMPCIDFAYVIDWKSSCFFSSFLRVGRPFYFILREKAYALKFPFLTPIFVFSLKFIETANFRLAKSRLFSSQEIFIAPSAAFYKISSNKWCVNLNWFEKIPNNLKNIILTIHKFFSLTQGALFRSKKIKIIWKN